MGILIHSQLLDYFITKTVLNLLKSCASLSIMNVLSYVLSLINLQTVYAHCDIPCGVYDPTPAQIAAHTVLRMTNLLLEIKVPEGENVDNLEYTKHHNSVVRMIHVKEKHGGLVEEELGTLDNDYFKPEHHKEFPELAKLLKSAVKLSITCRQNIDMKSANELLGETQKIAEIFYKTKDFEPIRIPSGFPTEGEIVSHK